MKSKIGCTYKTAPFLQIQSQMSFGVRIFLKVAISMVYSGACSSSSSDEGTDVGWVGLGLLIG